MREQIVSFFRAVSEAMIVIVHWVLLAGPDRACLRWRWVLASIPGSALQACCSQYIVIVAGGDGGDHCHRLADRRSRWGGQPIGRFTTAATPVWAIAIVHPVFTGLVAGDARRRAARLAHTRRALLTWCCRWPSPMFRFTSPVANLGVSSSSWRISTALQPTPLQIGGAVFVAYAMSVASVGLPGQVSFIASIAPICLALGVPTEVLGILDRGGGVSGHLPHARQRDRRSSRPLQSSGVGKPRPADDRNPILADEAD